MRARKEQVFVGLSGGVDSSVAAALLQRAGYDVVGVFIKVWHPPFLQCNWEAERLDAMRVAAHLRIPFLNCDAEEAYREEVAQYFIGAYARGLTPNPDVACNRAVKFGKFLSFAEAHGADYIATGHYARAVYESDGTHLLRGIDSSKDQSYFLWEVPQSALARSLFPLGEWRKHDTRRYARRLRLQTEQKPDSQGICFLGAVDIPEFLSHYLPLTSGIVRDETGKEIGTHRGAFVYTIGQRHGFRITDPDTPKIPYYVVARNLATNTLTVAPSPPATPATATVPLAQCNWIGATPDTHETYQAQFRYRQQPVSVHVYAENDTAVLTLDEEVSTPTPGQSCVLYRANECIGGGIIQPLEYGDGSDYQNGRVAGAVSPAQTGAITARCGSRR